MIYDVGIGGITLDSLLADAPHQEKETAHVKHEKISKSRRVRLLSRLPLAPFLRQRESPTLRAPLHPAASNLRQRQQV